MEEDIYEMPDGNTYAFPKGTPQEDVMSQLQAAGAMGDIQTIQPDAAYSPAPPEEMEFSPNPGFLNRFFKAAGSAVDEAAGSIGPAYGVTMASLSGDEQAFDESAAELARVRQAAAFYNPNPSSVQEIRDKYNQNGVVSAVAETFDFAAQTAGSSLGFMLPAMVGLAGAAVSSGPMAIAALGAGGVASFSTYYGSQLGRTLEETGEEADIDDISIPVQMLSAAGQAGLDMVAPIATGFTKNATLKAVAKSAKKAIITPKTKAARDALNTASVQTVNGALKKAYGTYAGRVAAGVALEVGTEELQTVLERSAAGLTIDPTDQGAFDEFLEVAVGAALLGTGFGAVGEYRKGSKEAAKIEETRHKAERVVERTLKEIQADSEVDTGKRKFKRGQKKAQPKPGEVIEPQTPSTVDFGKDGRRVVRDGDKRNHHVVRDADNKVVAVFPSLKKANAWRDIELSLNPESGLKDVSLESGFVIREEKVGNNGKAKQRRPVGFVSAERGDVVADQETIRLRGMDGKQKQLANERSKRRKTADKLWPQPESWESARSRFAPGSKETEPYTQIPVNGGSLVMPSIKAMKVKGSDVVIPNGEVDTKGNGYGVAKFNKDFQSNGKFKTWQHAASSFFSRMNTDKNFFNRKEIEHVPSSNGRTDSFIWKPEGSKSPVTFVFENYTDQKGVEKRVLSQVFTGRDYSSRVTSAGMEPGVSTTALIAAHGSKKAGKKSRIAKDKTNIEEAAKQVTAVNSVSRAEKVFNKIFERAAKVLRYDKDNPHQRFRIWGMDVYDAVAKSDHRTKVTGPDGKVRRMRSNESAEGAARQRAASVQMTKSIAEHGSVEYVKTDETGVTGTTVIKDHELEHSAIAVYYSKSKGGLVETEVTSDVFDGMKTGGVIPIMQALNARGGAALLQKFNDYRIALRAYNIEQENKTLPKDKRRPSGVSEKKIIAGLQAAKENPEIAVAHANVQLLNDKLTQYLVDTGVLKPETAAIWAENNDYVSFFVDQNATTNAQLKQDIKDKLEAAGEAPNVFQPLAYREPSQRRKGIKSEDYVFQDAVESTLLNMVAVLEAGMTNIAAQRTMRNEIADGHARRWKAGMLGNPIEVRVEGVVTKWQVDDEFVYDVLTSNDNIDINAYIREQSLGGHKGFELAAKPGHFLREGITRDVGFAVANLLRDSMQAQMVHGINPMAPLMSLNRAVKSMVDRPDSISSARKLMSRYAIVQGIDSVGSSRSRNRMAQEVAQDIRNPGGKKRNPASRVLFDAWDKLGEFTSASESATREQVFEKVYDESYSDLKADGKSDTEAHNIALGEALYQAREVMNFDRHGSSQALAFATSLTPFINSAIQGLDILYRAGINHRPVGASMAESDAFMKTAMRRIGAMMALSTGLELVNFFDEDYDNLEDYQRWNYFHIPVLGLKLPIPFQLGLLIKAPGMVLRSTMLAMKGQKERAWNELRGFTGESAGQALMVTGPSALWPTAVRPIMESGSWMNKSLFHGGQTNSPYDLDMPAAERGINNKTYISRMIAGALEKVGFHGGADDPYGYVSPGDLDNLVRSYTGTTGYFLLGSLDTMARWAMNEPSKPAPMAKDVILLSRFIMDETATGRSSEIMAWERELKGAVRAISQALSPGRKSDMEKKYAKEKAQYDRAKGLFKELRELNKLKRAVKQDEYMTGTEKTRYMDRIAENERELGKVYDAIRRQVDI